VKLRRKEKFERERERDFLDLLHFDCFVTVGIGRRFEKR